MENKKIFKIQTGKIDGEDAVKKLKDMMDIKLGAEQTCPRCKGYNSSGLKLPEECTWCKKDIVKIHINENFTYVKMNEIPKEFREEFDYWMRGQTVPIIENIENMGDVVYSWDWKRWYNMKVHKIPTYFD